eukprot:1543105-Alexandrium_andersonii.AAC.1
MSTCVVGVRKACPKPVQLNRVQLSPHGRIQQHRISGGSVLRPSEEAQYLGCFLDDGGRPGREIRKLMSCA